MKLRKCKRSHEEVILKKQVNWRFRPGQRHHGGTSLTPRNINFYRGYGLSGHNHYLKRGYSSCPTVFIWGFFRIRIIESSTNSWKGWVQTLSNYKWESLIRKSLPRFLKQPFLVLEDMQKRFHENYWISPKAHRAKVISKRQQKSHICLSARTFSKLQSKKLAEKWRQMMLTLS